LVDDVVIVVIALGLDGVVIALGLDGVVIALGLGSSSRSISSLAWIVASDHVPWVFVGVSLIGLFALD
jgi:hypothetical protein